jgi:eukaryotic-like serine/threonine-protein kinase
MSKRTHTRTKKVQLSNNETVTDFEFFPDLPEESTGMGSEQLKEHYDMLIRSKAIYYPVAYLFQRELGRGRQGIVFQALRQGSRGCITRHAIKIFDPTIYPSAKKYWTDMGRMAIQTSRLQTVRSPNLVARDVYEETNGIGYIQMEMIDGIDVRGLMHPIMQDRARRNSTSEEWAHFTDAVFRQDSTNTCIQPGVALYIMRQILRGLESLHDLGFVHSDIKPANIMVDRLGYAKLVDYGRAVMINETTAFLLGSPLYMAPETHRREPSTEQTDIYSVGLVGLEMLCGKPIVDYTHMTESDLHQFKLGLLNVLPDLLPDHVRQNEHLVYLFQRFLDPNPARRFGNAQEAESGPEGLAVVHKQLAQLGKDTEYGRELSNYLAKLVDLRSDQIAVDDLFS